MWNQKLCLYANMNRYIPDTIRQIGQAGFDATFFPWSPTNPVEECVAAAKESHLEIQSIHGPFTRSADMWGEDKEKGDLALQELKDCIVFCNKHEVPIMIAHTFIGFDQQIQPNPIGIDRFGELIRWADKYGVKIALENTEGEDFLAALMAEFRHESSVGFCWDTGHEMCYNHSKDMLSLYGDKLICTHLNDNLGIRDYEGIWMTCICCPLTASLTGMRSETG